MAYFMSESNILARKYTFDKLTPPYPGCKYGRYWAWNVRDYGRWLFKEAIQERPEDLVADPWWTENEPDPLP